MNEDETVRFLACNKIDYYERYLKQAKKAGLDVYIVEYRAGRELSKRIGAYCERHGYKWYNADSIELN